KKPNKPTSDAARLIPEHPTLPAVHDAASDCQACDLYKRGTQTVFGEGARMAEVMLVVEQPGAPSATSSSSASARLSRRRFWERRSDRAPDDDSRREEMTRFTDDLRKVRKALSSR